MNRHGANLGRFAPALLWLGCGGADRDGGAAVEACLDFGLERIQFSVFRGKLNRNKREELLMRLTQILGEDPGKVLIQPMCEDDFRSALELVRAERTQ